MSGTPICRQSTKIIIRNLPLRIFVPSNCLMTQMIQMYQDLVQRSHVLQNFNLASLKAHFKLFHCHPIEEERTRVTLNSIEDCFGFFASLKVNGYILKGPCSAN